tara:strand:- start:7207 stop:7866 length:660 start_codon:yes stop_codon:yes gene_type:complete
MKELIIASLLLVLVYLNNEESIHIANSNLGRLVIILGVIYLTTQCGIVIGTLSVVTAIYLFNNIQERFEDSNDYYNVNPFKRIPLINTKKRHNVNNSYTDPSQSLSNTHSSSQNKKKCNCNKCNCNKSKHHQSKHHQSKHHQSKHHSNKNIFNNILNKKTDKQTSTCLLSVEDILRATNSHSLPQNKNRGNKSHVNKYHHQPKGTVCAQGKRNINDFYS